MNIGYIFSVKFPAFEHYIVVLKENILDFKEIHEEVFTDKMSCNLLSSRSGKKTSTYIEKKVSNKCGQKIVTNANR